VKVREAGKMKGLTQKRLPRSTYWIIYTIVALAAIAYVVWAKLPDWRAQPQGESPEVFVRIDPRVVAADTTFGFKLFNELRGRDPSKNVFISPASLSLALTMTYNGASGETKAAMAKALGIEGLAIDDVNRANGNLLANLAGPGPNVALYIADSLWAREGIEFRPEFMEANGRHYKAEITTLDFGGGQAASRINRWVEEHTRGRIKGIVRDVHPDAILFLVNTVYFKGRWADRFDKRATRERPFHLVGGDTVEAPMMSQHWEFPYLETDQFQAINLAYGQGRLSMLVFLPSKESSLDAFCETLTSENWRKWIAGFANEYGDIALPRVKAQYGARKRLKDALTDMGMGVAFDRDRAEFEAMSPRKPIWIEEVAHKTCLAIDEEGTEAAAVTEVEACSGSAGHPGEPFEMIVDRPFFCAIVDNRTGVILFLGAITDPR
jgi:serine protease inhibitor